MTIPALQEIISTNIDAAESGDATAQGLVVRAMSELEEREEFGGFTREELTDFSMLTDDEMEGDW